MDHVKSFKDLFESIPDHKKIVIITFLIKKVNFSTECRLLKSDINLLCLECKNIILQQNE